MRLRDRWVKVLIGTAVSSALLLFGVDWWLNPSLPTLAADRVESIEVHLFNKRYTGPLTGQVASTTTVTDKEAIRKLLAAFAGAERASEHKADRSGALVLCFKDGSREEVSILPGYRQDRYEYRYGGRINSVDRAPFLAALESAGILSVALESQ